MTACDCIDCRARPSPSVSMRFALSITVALIATATATDVAVTAAASAVAVSAVEDSLRSARCFAKCFRQISGEKPKCYSGCMNERWTKPGQCPVGDLDGDDDVASLYRPCLEQCSSDDFCHAEHKCCRHSCGITCQPPVGLADSPGLPDEPKVVNVSDYGKTLVVEWTPPASDTGHVTYLVQERHHFGSEYVPERMTMWTTVTRTDRVREHLKLYAPGRWFQFRVAAINENGTRGYSTPSEKFFVQLDPHVDLPGRPENLAVSSLKWTNNEYQQCMLSWTPPTNSVLPVRKYKVFISVIDDSHIYHKRHVVPGDILRFPIKKLNSDSQYFLQVQAISEFGRKRLSGQTASITLKTKGRKSILNSKKITDLKVVNVTGNKNNGNLINVRISWRPVSMSSKKLNYTITWSPIDCKDRNKPKLIAKTQKLYFDLFSLNSQCKNSFTVSTTYNKSRYVGSFIFVTPTVMEF